MRFFNGCNQRLPADRANVAPSPFAKLVLFRLPILRWQVGNDITVTLQDSVFLTEIERKACLSCNNHHVFGTEFCPSAVAASLLYCLLEFCICDAITLTFDNRKWVLVLDILKYNQISRVAWRAVWNCDLNANPCGVVAIAKDQLCPKLRPNLLFWIIKILNMVSGAISNLAGLALRDDCQ